MSNVTRRAGAFVFFAAVTFMVVATVLQCLRPDLDWVQVPLSFFLIGPHAYWLRAAYVVLAAGLVVLGLAWYRVLSRPARRGLPAVLFMVAGIGLTVTAFATTNTYAHPATLHGFIHGVAAQTTFLCTTVAMLLLGWRLRLDARWKHLHAPMFGWALACFIGMWVQALWRSMPRGLSQKLLILALLGWLARMGWTLWRNHLQKDAASN